MAKLTADLRIIEHLKTFYQCRPINLADQKSQEIKEIRSSTVRHADLARNLGINPKTLSSAIQKHLINEKNILVYRFSNEGSIIPNEIYNNRKFPNSETRLGYKSKAGEKFVGEKILTDLGGRLLATSSVHKHFKITVGNPPDNTDSFCIYFVIRTDLVHLQIKNTIFDELNGKPFSLMLAQDYVHDFSKLHFIPGSEHIQPFNSQAALLNLPDQSLHLPSTTGNSSFPRIPNLGSITLTFYPGTGGIWITQLAGLWSPKFALLGEKDLGKKQRPKKNLSAAGKPSKPPSPILDLERWRRHGRIWPETLSRPSHYQPPNPTSIFKDGQDRYLVPPKFNSTLLSTKLYPPITFDLAPWLKMKSVVTGTLIEHEKSEANREKFKTEATEFKASMNALTWECKVPCLLSFRNFSLVIVK